MKSILILIMSLLLTGCYEIESGEKVGQVVRLSKGGLIIKTWDVTLIRGGFEDGSGSLGKSFEATVEDKAIREKIRAAMNSKKNVKVKYHREKWTFLRTNDLDNYFIDDVEKFE